MLFLVSRGERTGTANTVPRARQRRLGMSSCGDGRCPGAQRDRDAVWCRRADAPTAKQRPGAPTLTPHCFEWHLKKIHSIEPGQTLSRSPSLSPCHFCSSIILLCQSPPPPPPACHQRLVGDHQHSGTGTEEPKQTPCSQGAQSTNDARPRALAAPQVVADLLLSSPFTSITAVR